MENVLNELVFVQICTRDEATLKRRSRSHPRGTRNKRGLLFSSQKGLDSLTKHSREKRQSLSQVRVRA